MMVDLYQDFNKYCYQQSQNLSKLNSSDLGISFVIHCAVLDELCVVGVQYHGRQASEFLIFGKSSLMIEEIYLMAFFIPLICCCNFSLDSTNERSKW